jgi:hypothetical protein
MTNYDDFCRSGVGLMMLNAHNQLCVRRGIGGE